MKEAKQRKVHSPEFKAKVGLEALKGMITVNEFGQPFYGTRRMIIFLLTVGLTVNCKRVQRLTRLMGLAGIPGMPWWRICYH